MPNPNTNLDVCDNIQCLGSGPKTNSLPNCNYVVVKVSKGTTSQKFHSRKSQFKGRVLLVTKWSVGLLKNFVPQFSIANLNLEFGPEICEYVSVIGSIVKRLIAHAKPK